MFTAIMNHRVQNPSYFQTWLLYSFKNTEFPKDSC